MSTQLAGQKDLIVLVADSQQEKTISTLLDSRRESLQIAAVSYEIYPHEGHDPGVFVGAGDFLSIFTNQFRYALVVLDAAWAGQPGSANEIVSKIQMDLDQTGWHGRSNVIVIDPELEIWVWSDSPHVPQILGLEWGEIHRFAEENDYWLSGVPKPYRPKELLDDILQRTNKRRSAALFVKLAMAVSLDRCHDPAFNRFRATLHEWFPRI